MRRAHHRPPNVVILPDDPLTPRTWGWELSQIRACFSCGRGVRRRAVLFTLPHPVWSPDGPQGSLGLDWCLIVNRFSEAWVEWCFSHV